MPAKRVFESCGSIEIIEQPVERFAPFRILFQDLPPSAVLYSPRSWLSLQSFPGTHAHTTAGRTDINGEASVFFYRGDGGDTPAHSGGTDVARATAGDGVGIELSFLRR